MKTRLISLRHTVSARIVAAVIAAAASFVAAGPADASVTYTSGYPGSVTVYPLPIECELVGNVDYSAPNDGYHAVLVTPLLNVRPSASYSLPQTIQEGTRVDYSSDSGRTWYVWKWVNQSVPVFSRSLISLQPQWIDLPKGWSYRIVQVVQFKAGNNIVGTATTWYTSWNDYSFLHQAAFSDRISTSPTRYSPGCTVS